MVMEIYNDRLNELDEFIVLFVVPLYSYQKLQMSYDI